MIKRSCTSFATFELALLYLMMSEGNIPLPTSLLQSNSSTGLSSPPLTPVPMGPTDFTVGGCAPFLKQTVHCGSPAKPSREIDGPGPPPDPALQVPQGLDKTPSADPAPPVRAWSEPATLGEGPPFRPLTHASHCARRMLLASLIVSWKFLHDKTYSSRAWSKITGLSSSEISNNEILFLRDLLAWDLYVDKALFWNWSGELERAAWQAAAMRKVRGEKLDCARSGVTLNVQLEGRVEADMLRDMNDGSVRNYSAANLVCFMGNYYRNVGVGRKVNRAGSAH